MVNHVDLVPEDPAKPGFDVFGGTIGRRPHFIHEVMARAGVPLTKEEIGEQAERLAKECGVPFNARTYAPDVTGNHLRQHMRNLVYCAEQLPDGRWQLTERAHQLIAAAREKAVVQSEAPDSVQRRAPVGHPSPTPSELRTVDSKCRILLPRQFANATVMLEMVGESEVRIRKAVVVPEASLPTIEDALPPLSDEDRDFFLNLIDNPPEPNAAFRRAARHYKKWHERHSDRTAE